MSVSVVSASLAPGAEIRKWPRTAVWSRLAEHRKYPKSPAGNGACGDAPIELYSPHERIVVGRIRGHFTAALAQEWIAGVDSIVATTTGNAPVAGFHDWELMTGYDSASRRDLTAYILRTLGRHGDSHLLVGSKLVAMGVSAAALTLGLVGLKMYSYTDRAKFEKDLAAAI